MPQHVPLLQILRSRDVGHVNVQPAVVIEVAEVDVHPLFGIRDDRRLRCVDERAVALVDEQLVRAKIVGAVQVRPTVVVHIGSPHGECPTGVIQTKTLRHLHKCAVLLLTIEVVLAPVPRGLEAVVHNPRRLQVPKINLVEVVADVQIQSPIEVVIEEDHRVAVRPLRAR